MDVLVMYLTVMEGNSDRDLLMEMLKSRALIKYKVNLLNFIHQNDKFNISTFKKCISVVKIYTTVLFV